MIIGIDIGGSKTNIGISYNGESLEEYVTIATPSNQRKAVFAVQGEIRKLVGNGSVDGIGISCPGPLNLGRGMITEPHHLPWNNLRLRQPLAKQFGCPVVLEHDASAGGLAEARFGAGKKYNLVSYITISTGIGNSLLLGGELVRGQHNSEGGSQIVDFHEAEHSPRSGSFSHLTNGLAIERDFGARPSDIKSRNQWRLIARRLSYGIYNIITITAPDCVVLGGGVATNYKQFIGPLQKELKRLSPVYSIPPILKAKYVETAPLMGAIYLAAKAL